VEPKTPQAVREIVLMPALTRMLREHKLASDFSTEFDRVFPSERGTALNSRNLSRRGLDKGVNAAGLRPIRFHDLRHTFASILIDQGHNVVWIARQLGHANPSITLNVYAHLFAKAEHAERMRSRMEESFGSMLDREPDGEPEASSPPVPALPNASAEVASLHGRQESRALTGTGRA
jgi:hypothetical protein